MSFEYTIKFSGIRPIKIEDIISYWETETGHEFNIIESNMCFIFQEGSIRGIYFWREKRNYYTLRVNHYASKEDIELVYRFVKFLNEFYNIKIKGEDGISLTKYNFSKDYFIDRLYIENPFDIMEYSFNESNEPMILPVLDFEVTIEKDLYIEMKNNPEFPNNLTKRLQEEVWDLLRPRRADCIATRKGNTVSVWSFEEMYVMESDYIAVMHPDDVRELPEDEDDITMTCIKWEYFIQSEYVKYKIIQNQDQIYYRIHELEEDLMNKVYEEFQRNSIPMELI